MATKSRLIRELRNANRLLRKAQLEAPSLMERVRPSNTYKEIQRRLKEVKPLLKTEAVKEIQRQEREMRNVSGRKKTLAKQYESKRQSLLEAGVPERDIPHALPASVKKFREQDLKTMVGALTLENVTTKQQVTPTESVSQAIITVAEAERQSVKAYADAESKRRLSTETTVHGKKTGLTRGEMGDLRQMSHAPTGEFRGDRGYANWEKHLESIEKYLGRDDAELYKESYINALLTEFGERAYDLIYAIEKTNADTFLNWYYQEEDVDVNYFYAMDAKDDNLSKLTETYLNLGMKNYKANRSFDEDFIKRQTARAQRLSGEIPVQ